MSIETGQAKAVCAREFCKEQISPARIKRKALYCSYACAHKVANAAHYTAKHPNKKLYTQQELDVYVQVIERMRDAAQSCNCDAMHKYKRKKPT